MLTSWLRKKNVRITLILVAILIFFAGLIQWWIRFHIKDILEELVATESKGKVVLQIGKMQFSPFNSPRIDLDNTRLILMDSTGKELRYTVHFGHLGMELNSFRSLLLKRQLLVDFIVIQDPHIEVNSQPSRKAKGANHHVSLELGNVFHAIEKIVNSLQVKKFRISKGSMELRNLPPHRRSIRIAGVDFSVDDFSFVSPGDTSLGEDIRVRKLQLKTGRQQITFPKGDYTLQYASLDITTSDRSITIDSFQISGKASDTSYNELKAGFSRLKLIRPDLHALYDSSLIRVDSLYCLDPVLRLKLDVSKRNKSRKEPDQSIEKAIAGLLGYLDIGYIGLLNSEISILTKNENRYRPFATRGNNFEVYGIRVDSTRQKPIEVKKLVFAIKNYIAYSSDSLYDVRFDSVVYDNSSLSFRNFRVAPTLKNKASDKKYISVPDFSLRDLSLSELISNRRLSASALVLRGSKTINYYLPKTRRVRPTQPLKSIIRDINNKIDLGTVILEDGYLLSQSVTDPKQKVEVTHYNSTIAANELLKAPSYELMGYAIGELRFEQARIQNSHRQIVLDNGYFSGRQELITATKASFVNTSPQTEIVVHQLRLRNYQFDDSLKALEVDSIHWASAEVSFEQGGRKEKVHREKNAMPQIDVRNLSGGPTAFSYSAGDSVRIRTLLSALGYQELKMRSGEHPMLKGLFLDGRDLVLETPQIKLRALSYGLRDHMQSELRDVLLEWKGGQQEIRGTLPLIRMVPMLQESIQKGYPIFRQIELDDPVLEAVVRGGNPGPAEAKTKKKGGRAELGQFRIRDATAKVTQVGGGKTSTYSTNDLDLNLQNLVLGGSEGQVMVGAFTVDLNRFQTVIGDSLRINSDKGRLHLAGSRLFKGHDPRHIEVQISTLRIDSLNLALLTRGGGPVELKEINIGADDLRFDSTDRRHIAKVLRGHPSVFIKNINLRKKTPTHLMAASGIDILEGGKMIQLDSFVFQPTIDRDSFNRMHIYQTDLIQLRTGRITVRELDLESLFADSLLRFRHMEVLQPNLTVYKDKRLPFLHGVIKPLPVHLIGKIKQAIQIDSIRLRQGRIIYEEFNDQTRKLGVVHFDSTEAEITNIRNRGIRPNDSLRLRAITRFMDTARTRMAFVESYTDSLAGFLMILRISPFGLPALNPMLEPIASAEVTRGYLDTLSLRVVGREYVAHGKMQMYYRDLKVKVLNKKDSEKKTILTRLENLAAGLLVNKKNVKKTGTVFTERIRERSIFNYWIKIVLSGSLTNAGIKSNTKQEKKYIRKVKKLQVPELPEVVL